MSERLCAQGYSQGGEFSLCGDAYDAVASGDSDTPYRLAERGERVNCENCLAALRYLADRYTPNGLVRL